MKKNAHQPSDREREGALPVDYNIDPYDQTPDKLQYWPSTNQTARVHAADGQNRRNETVPERPAQINRAPQGSRSYRSVAERQHESSMAVPAKRRQKNRKLSGKRPKRTKKQKIQLGLAIAGIVLVILGLIVFVVWRSMMNQVNINPEGETLPEEYNFPTESLVHAAPEIKGITNILLLGVDSRDSDTAKTLSDTMMILTVDTINNKIKLTSLQRDMLVYLPGKSTPTKINAANSAGGPTLAMRVVNDTFRLNIMNYVVVNLRNMEQIIDIAGGVTLDVPQNMVSAINGEISYQNSIFPDTKASGKLAKGGVQLLNGRQAVAFSRIRKLDSDYARNGRQREVLQALMTSFVQANVLNKSSMIMEGLSYITTNLTEAKLTSLGLDVLPLMDAEIEQLQIPIKGYFNEDQGGDWFNRCDFNGMIPLLQEFIWGKTFSFDPVKEIPGAPNGSGNLPVSGPKTTTKATTAAPAVTTAAPTTLAPTTEMTTTAETTLPTDPLPTPTTTETAPTTTVPITTTTTATATTTTNPTPTTTTANTPATTTNPPANDNNLPPADNANG